MSTSPTPDARPAPATSRRAFLRAGMATVGGLALPDLLRLRAASGEESRRTAVIFVYLGGGDQSRSCARSPSDAGDGNDSTGAGVVPRSAWRLAARAHSSGPGRNHQSSLRCHGNRLRNCFT